LVSRNGKVVKTHKTETTNKSFYHIAVLKSRRRNKSKVVMNSGKR